MNINEYKDEINKIVPSESFISETEALMKKARDEQLAASRGITMRKTVLRSMAAAAAVLVCAAAVTLYSRNLNTGIEGGEKPAETSDSITVTEDTRAETSAPEEESEEAAVPAAGITEETAGTEEAEEMIEAEDVTENVTITETTAAETEETQKSAEEPEAETVLTEAEPPAETAAETQPEAPEPPAAPVQEEDIAYEEDSSYDAVLYADEELFEDGFDDDEAPAVDAGAGLYGYNDGSAEVFEEEEEYFGEAAGQSVYGGYDSLSYGMVSNTYSASYNMSSSDMSILSAKDEVYVPDSIDMLDEGTYCMKVSAGSGEKEITSDNSSALNSVIDCIDSISYNNSPVYSDKKTDLEGCRGKIEICSVQTDGDTVMFEVMYNEEYMVINRYDNGTVSSERYTISETDVRKADSTISSCAA